MNESEGTRVRAWTPRNGEAMKLTDDMAPYRVGLGADLASLRFYYVTGRWPEFRYVLLKRIPRGLHRRSWWGLWQAEWEGCQRAVRGLTTTGTYRRAVRVRARREASHVE